MKLYAVVTIREEMFYRDDGTSYLGTDNRCVMIAADKKVATDMVLNNDMDINEDGYYPWAVVEELESDMPYGFGSELPVIDWYHWAGAADGSYVKCDVPEKWTNIITLWG